MIVKIKQIHGIDAFDQVKWDGEDLKTYNLFYGWNGSGKTTVSRILSFLEKKEIGLNDYQSIEFGIQTTTGVLKTSDIKSHSLDLRVFNEDFVKGNVFFDDSTAKHIIIIGKENLDLQKEITALEEEKKATQDELEKLQGKRPKAIKHEQILTEAAQDVTKQFGYTPLANDVYYGRSYKKTKVEDLLAEGLINEQILDSLIITDPEVLSDKREIVKSEKSVVSLTLTELEDNRSLFDSANSLLKLNIKYEEIEELNADRELRDWTEAGYHLHKDRNLLVCQFCHNQVTKDRFETLGRYFTLELQDTKNKIDDNVRALKKVEEGETNLDIDSGKLFPDIAKEYLKSKQLLETNADNIRGAIKELISNLEKKKYSLPNMEESFVYVPYPEEQVGVFNEALEEIRRLFNKHNERVRNSEKESSAAAKSIELHTIATIFRSKDYFLHKKEHEEAENKKSELVNKIEKLAQNISAKRGTMKNTALAAEKINAIASEYFGEGQIYLEINESNGDSNGYVLKRRKKIAKHLSEGEKSALALIYFFVKLEEEGCNKSSCIVVIDDPVDSQDARFLFQTYGLLKRQLKGAKQLIVFTHNYEFFNLLRDWFISKKYKDDSRLYFTSINEADSVRELIIEDLPALLKDYKSEYQYLFSRLYLYANGRKDLDEPLVANVARKVLEYFASFKWACKTEEEFANIVLTRYVEDENQFKRGVGDFIVKFVNEYSHGEEFSRPISATMLEAEKIAEKTLQFIKLADEEHYDKIKKICV